MGEIGEGGSLVAVDPVWRRHAGRYSRSRARIFLRNALIRERAMIYSCRAPGQRAEKPSPFALAKDSVDGGHTTIVRSHELFDQTG